MSAEEKVGDSDVLRDLRDFCSSIEFQQQAEEFALDHCHHFDDEDTSLYIRSCLCLQASLRREHRATRSRT